MTARPSAPAGHVHGGPGLSASAPPPAAVLPARLAADLNHAGEFARAEKAAATRRAYRSDFAIFHAWCCERMASALPASAETVAAFLASEARRRVKPSTLGRRVASIRYAHKLAGHPTPTDDERVRATLRGIRRTAGMAPSRKAPATADRLIAMAAIGDGGIATLRDRALLLLGFGGAFRRSELVALDVADIAESNDGLLVTIRRSKTDQEGRSITVAIVRGKTACPVAALRAWLTAAGVCDGPVFRPITKGSKVRQRRLSDRSVANIIKHRGDDPLEEGDAVSYGHLDDPAQGMRVSIVLPSGPRVRRAGGIEPNVGLLYPWRRTGGRLRLSRCFREQGFP
jgi:site-specific recombinase XerD